MAWLMSMVFVEANENILEWILSMVSHTLKYCSEYEDELFRFVPEYYIENIIGLVLLLPDYSKPIQTFESIDLGNCIYFKSGAYYNVLLKNLFFR